jgi:hypothetical protein
MRKLFIAIIVTALFASCRSSQTGNSLAGKPETIINAAEVERIEKVLSADGMEGRKAGTPGIDKAASFIESEFRAAGLQPFNGANSFKQEFRMLQPKHVFTAATINGQRVEDNNVVVITQKPAVTVTDASGFEKVNIAAGQNLFQEIRKYYTKNAVIVVDTSHRKNFMMLTRLRRPSFPADVTQVYFLATETPASFAVTSRHTVAEVKMANVVGMLPGKSRKDEYVVFSAHHDHIGIGKPTAEGDSIYNGANDDAAGTTAVIMLAKYFRALNNNERTLLFVTFTAEEMGGFGSQYFSKQLDPEKVMAMFNIEMIGTESKWGTNSAYITGFDKSDMGAILQKNLEGTGFIFHPDPYPQQQLFLRSDNATLARLGVPAHTISTSKMDVEKYYHTADDEIETLDMKNMAAIIKAIALSSRGIVAGTETPSRVKN